VGEIGHLFNIIFTFPIFNGLMLLYQLFGDFALAIVVLTVIIKLVLFPLTLQSLKSTKAMQQLQPQLAEIRKKYTNQQQQLAETQRLYKEAGVNPAAGCLPMLIQLPVLYGLFYAINNPLHSDLKTINAQLYPFVPPFDVLPNLSLNWFTFLNPAWHISLVHPDPTFVLPVLAALATFVQLRMSQPKQQNGGPPVSDQAAQMNKIMQFMMPVMVGIFGATAAAGLALYWTVSSIFQAVQQYFVTGWGALMVAPSLNLLGGDTQAQKQTTNSTSDKKRQRAQEQQASEVGVGDGKSSKEASGPVGSKLRTNGTYSTNTARSANQRRQRSSSASARRRGGTQKSRR
jgi:YidC/Oxa1 family membrane protein insertase